MSLVLSDTTPAITIVDTQDWPTLEQQLRRTTLLGDPTQLPYQHAQISLRMVETEEIKPLARYILKNNLETQRFLHWAFAEEQGIDTLSLEPEQARIEFQLDGEADEWALIPPIIEVSTIDHQAVLVDGEHRFFLARELGVPIQVIWIEQVPAEYPVVALPLSWSEVEVFDEVPPTFNKRDYRYPTLESMPDISHFSEVTLTPENYLYFFFRDLSSVCTSGVRRSGSRH
jgi:hypothetical protein